uniref:Uncharacterized protein n=1 Tax=Parascaris univalens TaxID=6257 RepID=A0A915B2Z4_PARUN
MVVIFHCSRAVPEGMPLIDLAEAASRGEIIVDEFDALNAVSVGKLSELESARISPIIAAHTMNMRNAVNGSRNVDAAGISESTWIGVLVDEVELARAAAEQASANPAVRMPLRGDDAVARVSEREQNAARMGMESAEVEPQSTVWRTLLVDEVDFKHAMQHGDVAPDNTHLSSLHYESSAQVDDEAEMSLDDGVLSEGEDTSIDDLSG